MAHTGVCRRDNEGVTMSCSPFWRLCVLATVLALTASACTSSEPSNPLADDSAVAPSDQGEQLGLCAPPISAVRSWNEAALEAIRRDFPAPTVHARNLYHLSAANWDAWAAYDTGATGLFFTGNAEQPNGDAETVETARAITISYASHRLLTTRYADAVGAEESLAQFDLTMEELCLSTNLSDVADNDAATLGLEIADTVLASTENDGASATITYSSVNQPLVVDEVGTEMLDPNRWQPLLLAEQVTQNGLDVPSGLQEFVGHSWGRVTSFALVADPERGLPIDLGPPPLLGVNDAAFVAGAVEVISLSSVLDPTQSELIDISPASLGNAPLDTGIGTGHEMNPATGRPYEPNLTSQADYGRAIAEYWADGPNSETPPGHWNTIANDVSDQLATAGELMVEGRGDPVNRLEWDVKLAIALNGATHDAAIAAWGAKEFYDYVRPISMIRYLGQRNELTDVPGLIETVTAESSAPGERHAHLAEFVGQQAVWAWQGPPGDVELSIGGVGWIAAATWVPYQRPTFVTPSFPAYVSGHSAFSRAAAVVLTEMTGSEFFPGGMGGHTIDVGDLIHEGGPDDAIALQWATYFDAADEAGRSRLYGGIHVAADDLQGRGMGAVAGNFAWLRAQDLFSST